jgi:hypothetical protein
MECSTRPGRRFCFTVWGTKCDLCVLILTADFCWGLIKCTLISAEGQLEIFCKGLLNSQFIFYTVSVEQNCIVRSECVG